MSFAQFRLDPQIQSVAYARQNLGGNVPSQVPMMATPLMDANPRSGSGQFQVHLDVPNPKPEPHADDDGYTLVFTTFANFEAWRANEEESNMVEFIKGDTHSSKAQPPRFKAHTKLVCARHSRSGRKKYVKKHPERQRKVPSRKLEGTGCPAFISYKTYFDSDTVHASYQSQHSHETGLTNLPFTKRGRKQLQEQERQLGRRKIRNTADRPSQPADLIPAAGAGSWSLSGALTVPVTPSGPVPLNSNVEATAGPSRLPPNVNTHSGALVNTPATHAHHDPPLRPSIPDTFISSHPLPVAAYLPIMTPPMPQPQHVQPQPVSALVNEQWDRLSILFNQIRDTARSYNYPTASVALLETVIVRLYVESPSMTDHVSGMHSVPSFHHHHSSGAVASPTSQLGASLPHHGGTEDDDMDAEGELEYEGEEENLPIVDGHVQHPA